jgi:hypothetical protein
MFNHLDDCTGPRVQTKSPIFGVAMAANSIRWAPTMLGAAKGTLVQ